MIQPVNGALQRMQMADYLDHPPPGDVAAEMTVVGDYLLFPDRTRKLQLHAADFTEHRCEIVFSIIRRILSAGELVDVRTVHAHLKSEGHLNTEAAGHDWREFLLACQNHGRACPSRNDDYAKQVRKAYMRRQAWFTALNVAKAAKGTQPLTELLGQAVEMFGVLRSDGGSDAIDYGGLTCAELYDHVDATTYYVDGLLAAGQPLIIAGASKALKTLTALDLCVSLATGTPAFGSFSVPVPVRVGMMTGESGMTTTRRNLISICEARGLDFRRVAGLIIAPKLPRFGDARHGVAIRKYIEKHRLQVLIVDPAYLCMPGSNAGNLFAQGELLVGMNDICADLGCTLGIVHHTRHVNNNPYAVPTLDDIAWSGFSEWCRQWILVGRRERYETGTGLHKLWMNVGGSAGHQLLRAVDVDEGVPGDRRWKVDLYHADEVRQRRQDDKAADKAAAAEHALEKLLGAAAQFPNGETKTELRNAASLKDAAMRVALSTALSLGKLVPCEIIKNKRKEDAYKPAPEPAPEPAQ